MMQEVFTSSFLRIQHDDKSLILICIWVGKQSEEIIKAGCWQIHQAMFQYQAFRIINDTQQVPGGFDLHMEWLHSIWLPIMIRDGMTKLAWLQTAEHQSITDNGSTPAGRQTNLNMVHTFRDVDTALTWLMREWPLF